MTEFDDLPEAVITGLAMQLIRTERRMRASEVAEQMRVPLRTYEHLENGRARVTYDRLNKFAKATSCDVFALMACVALRNPRFALHCADNKAAGVMLMALAELHEKLGSDLPMDRYQDDDWSSDKNLPGA